MQKIPTTGNAGLHGWSLDYDDLEDYRDSIIQAWGWWSRLWYSFRPPVKEKIAYTRPDGGVSIVTPDVTFLALLRQGGVIRHMRVIDDVGERRIPLFEGTGELLPPMSQKEALEFVAWKDIPRGINHIAVIDGDSLPESRERRENWRLSGDGRVVEA